MSGEKGFSIIEVLISLALVGIISVTFLSTLGTVSAVTLSADERETGKNLAETQLEYAKSQLYATSYSPAPIPSEYVNYSAVIDAEPLQDSNIQKLTVTIRHQAKLITKLEGYKVR